MLKPILDSLDGVSPAVREHYTKASDGKFHLALDGEHPDTAKVKEMRATNVELMKERDADRAKLAELEKATPRIAALEAELAAERTKSTEAQQQANKSRVHDALRLKALAAGALPAALDMLLAKADAVFTMSDDVLKARPNVFSPSRPGEPLGPDEWILGAIREFPFLFKPSTGSGAEPKPGPRGNSRELRDPTPQQLGQYAREIKSGELKVVYSNS